jgi:hypothetical protein
MACPAGNRGGPAPSEPMEPSDTRQSVRVYWAIKPPRRVT